jgi:hypothetical protein
MRGTQKVKGKLALTKVLRRGLPVARFTRAFTEAGTVTLRPRFTTVGAKILRHHKRTRIIIGLGTLREDGRYWSSPGDWSYTKLVR